MSSYGQLRLLLFELVTSRMSECPLSLKGSDRTKPDQRGHAIKLFFQILGARALVTAMDPPVFGFPTKGHISVEIIYFELIWVLRDLRDTECQRF